MHELSLAIEIGRIAGERMGAGAAQVVTVGVEVGRDAGVEVENLRFCLEAVLAEPPFRDAHPSIALLEGDDLRLAWLEVDDGCPDD